MTTTIIENQLATLDSNQPVFVIDAYSDYPNVLVSDDDGKEIIVNYSRLDQAPLIEMEEEAELAEIQREKDLTMIREDLEYQ